MRVYIYVRREFRKNFIAPYSGPNALATPPPSLLLGLLRFHLFLRLFFCSCSDRARAERGKKKKTRKKRLPQATTFGARDKGPTLLYAGIPSDLYANDGEALRRRYGCARDGRGLEQTDYRVFSAVSLTLEYFEVPASLFAKRVSMPIGKGA